MKYTWLLCCLCILYDYLNLGGCGAQDACPTEPVIVLQLTPELLIVPVNTPVLLTCEVYYNGCSYYSVRWYRDSEARTVIDRTLPNLVNNSTIYYTLNVTSEYKGTHIRCEMTTSELNPSTHISDAITVKSIPEVGVAPNPKVEPITDNEPPVFHLKWSPPFIWEAFPIHYCVVSIIHTIDSDSVHYGKNKKVTAESTTTFIESGIMSLNESIDDSQSQNCTQITFVITGFNQKNEYHNKSVSVTGRYPAGLGNFSESAISTVVASDAITKKLLVRIEIELPSLCSYQEMSYTILIDSATGSSIFFQTFYHTGSGIVCHDVNQDDADGLELNKNFTLKVTASTPFTQPVEACHEFNTNGAYGIKRRDYFLIVLLTILSSIFWHCM